MFGGCVKKNLSKTTPAKSEIQQKISRPQVATTEAGTFEGGVWNTVTSMTMSKVKLNMKLLGNFQSLQENSPTKEEEHSSFQEIFHPPSMSIVAYLLTKPKEGN